MLEIVGVALAPAVLPLRGVLHTTVLVDPPDLAPAVARIVALCVGAGQVVLEHAPFYVPSGKSPQAIAAMAAAHEVATVLEVHLQRELGALGIPVATIPRATWTHRVVPHTRGGISDAVARAGLEAHV